MDQARLSRPAEAERWLAAARAFATPGQPDFVQALDSLRPGPLLVAVIELSTNDLGSHSDAELAAVLRACERLIAYARYMQFLLIADLARRGLAASEDVA